MSYWSSSSLVVGTTAAIVVVLFLGMRIDTTAWKSTSAGRGRVEVAVRLNDRRVDSLSSGRTNDSRERQTPHERFNVPATRTTTSYVELETVSLSARVDVQPRPSPPPEDVITTVASTTKTPATTASSSSLPTRILSTEVHTTSGSPIAAVSAPRPPASTGDGTATTVTAASVEVRKCAPPDYAPIPCQNLTDDILKTLVAIEVDAAQGLGCQLLFLVRYVRLSVMVNVRLCRLLIIAQQTLPSLFVDNCLQSHAQRFCDGVCESISPMFVVIDDVRLCLTVHVSTSYVMNLSDRL